MGLIKKDSSQSFGRAMRFMVIHSILQRVGNPIFWKTKITDARYFFSAWKWNQQTPRFFNVKHGQLFLEPREGFRAYLRAHDMWEPAVRDKLYSVVREGDVVLDLGSNYGEFALQMSDLVGSRGKVIGMEMDTHYYHILTLLQEYNSALRERAIFLNEPFSSKTGLDWLLKKTKMVPTFYFSDIEGAERVLVEELFRSPQWLKNSPRLLLELHPEIYGETVKSEIIEKFKKAGYTVEEVDYKHYYFSRD